MHPIFERPSWTLSLGAPWRAKEVDACIEITQPDGVGALHISSAHKRSGNVGEDETLSQTKTGSSVDSEIEPAQFGEFVGHASEYVDWHTDRFWKKWFLGCRSDLLFVSYTCKRGDEELELPQVIELLKSLRTR